MTTGTPMPPRTSNARRPTRARAPWAWRAVRIATLLPPFAAAFYSLTQPWARARVIAVWGISRSVEATLLVAACLAVALAAGIVLTWHRRHLRLVALVYLGIGLLLAFVSWQAFTMVRDAGVRALGVIPIASVKPGRGLHAFAAAAAWMLVLGGVELGLALRAGRRKPRSAAA